MWSAEEQVFRELIGHAISKNPSVIQFTHYTSVYRENWASSDQHGAELISRKEVGLSRWFSDIGKRGKKKKKLTRFKL